MNCPTELRQALSHHYGSESLFRHSLNRNVVYTEGVQCFAKNAGSGAYWLLDIIAREPAILQQAREFASIKLNVTAGVAVLTADNGNGEVIYRRAVAFTDCPEGEWLFFFTNNTILLPSEY